MVIDSAYIAKKRSDYQHQLVLVQGALLALDDLERDMKQDDSAASMDQLKQVLGVAEIDEPQPV